MVSENLTLASAMDVTSQCFISDISGGFVHPQAFDNACQWSRRNQENITYANAIPLSYEAQRSNIYQNGCPVGSNVSKDPEISRRGNVYMDMQCDKENDHQSFYSGHGQRLSLTLNCQRQNDQLEEDPRQRHRQGTMYPGSDCMFPKYSSGTCAMMDSGPSSTNVASTTCIIRNSRYLKLAQQLLDEVVCVSDAAELDSINLFKKSRSVGITMQNVAAALQPGNFMSMHEREAFFLRESSSKEKHGVQMRIMKLSAILDELYRKYEKYCHQIGGVISSFEAVAGPGAAKPYIAMTIQAMTCHMSKLRETIISQLQASRESLLVCRNPKRISQLKSSHQNHTQTTSVLSNLAIIPHQQVWRPLRGLPENSVVILRTWLFEHFLHPYPNESEKLMLSSQTGLTRSQISNWFINARVRLWKPMIEEMYKEEFAEETNNSNPAS